MSTSRRATVAGGEVPEKRRRFSLFRTRTSENVLAAVEQVSRTAGVDTASPATSTPSSPFASTSSEGSAPRADSVYSSASTSEDLPLRARAGSPLGRVPEDEDTRVAALETDADGLPTYASATHPSMPTTYRFTRTSPFAMVLEQEGGGVEHGLYHISVGVNVWMPSCTVTTVRRGPAEDGPVIAQLEMGISSIPATILIGDVCKPINQVYFRKSSTSSSRLYFIGDGTALKWKLGASVWQVCAGATLLATFAPIPPRKLTLQPPGHRLSDHIMISLVLLMREHLTPLAGMSGDAAQLFNYSPHYNYRED